MTDFFSDAGHFCGNVRVVCVIVSQRNSAAVSRRRITNVTGSTVRQMCACNTAQPLSLRPRSSWQGVLRPPLHPPARAFSRGPDRGDFIPRTHDQGGLRARPGPPDRGRLRSPSGHPSTRLSQPWTAPKGVAPGPGLAPWPVPYAPCRPAGLACRPRRIVRRPGRRLKPDPVGRSGGAHRGRCSRRGLDALRPLPLLCAPPMHGRKPLVNST